MKSELIAFRATVGKGMRYQVGGVIQFQDGAKGTIHSLLDLHWDRATGHFFVTGKYRPTEKG